MDFTKFKKYYDAGWSYGSIAAELDTTAKYIKKCASQFQKAGRLKPRTKAFKPIDHAASYRHEQRIEEVFKMRKQRFSNKEIAEALGIAVVTVKKIVSGLIAEGRIISRMPT